MDGFSMQQCMLMCHACFMFVSSPGPSHEDTVLAKLSDLIIILLLRANNQAWSGIDMLVGSTYVQCNTTCLLDAWSLTLRTKRSIMYMAWWWWSGPCIWLCLSSLRRTWLVVHRGGIEKDELSRAVRAIDVPCPTGYNCYMGRRKPCRPARTYVPAGPGN